MLQHHDHMDIQYSTDTLHWEWKTLPPTHPCPTPAPPLPHPCIPKQA